ncbi:MAG: hypothetical protein QM479_05390 [Pseudomonadota bacterium]
MNSQYFEEIREKIAQIQSVSDLEQVLEQTSQKPVSWSHFN